MAAQVPAFAVVGLIVVKSFVHQLQHLWVIVPVGMIDIAERVLLMKVFVEVIVLGTVTVLFQYMKSMQRRGWCCGKCCV